MIRFLRTGGKYYKVNGSERTEILKEQYLLL